MMQKIQKFGGAMFTPVLLFAFSGIMVGITTVLTSEVIVGSIAEATTTWYKVWWTVKEGAWTIFRQIPLLFVVSLPIGLAKKQQARACMEALLLYLTFNYFIAAILTNWGTALGVDYSVEAGNGTGLALVASIKTLDTNMVGALVVAGIVVYLHNKYFNTKLPEWLGVFKGSCFVCAIGFFVMLALAVVFCFVWPIIQTGMKSLQGFFMESGPIGVWVFSFCERILIPTGLHHFVYMPFAYESIAVDGGFKAAWALNLSEYAASSKSLATLFPAGRYLGDAISYVFLFLGDHVPFIAVAVLAACLPWMIMAGMHTALSPFMIQNMDTIGYDAVIRPAFVLHNVAEGGACLGVALRTKDKEFRSECLSLAVGAIVAGVTEPAIYGCNLKYKKPMYGVMGGAAIGGIVASLLGARAFVFGYSNLLAIAPMFLSTAWAMFIGAAVSIVAAAIITYVLGIDEGPIKAAKRK